MQIEIDFEVFKALTVRRASEAVTYNDVLRALLDLPPISQHPPLPTPSSAGDWIRKGVHFPTGTEFRASYGGEFHFAKVESGELVVKGTRTTSPSDAAKVITGTNVNGWSFWECRFPGEDRWQPIKALRPRR